jgi:hypothetical protein
MIETYLGLILIAEGYLSNAPVKICRTMCIIDIFNKQPV